MHGRDHTPEDSCSCRLIRGILDTTEARAIRVRTSRSEIATSSDQASSNIMHIRIDSRTGACEWTTRRSRSVWVTFVLHAPLKLADDRLAGEVVKEWLRVDWYLLQESVQELTAKIIGTRHSPTLQLVSKVWTLARRRAGFLNRRYRADLGVGSTKASESH